MLSLKLNGWVELDKKITLNLAAFQMKGPACSSGRSGGLFITVAALVPHWPLELLYFVFAKEDEVLFHPKLFTLTGCILSDVSAAYIKIVSLWEASFMDFLYLLLHRTCTMHRRFCNSVLILIF